MGMSLRERQPTVQPSPKHSVSVAGIVVDAHDRVLVIQRHDNGPGQGRSTAEARQIRWMTRDEVRKAMTPAYAVRVLDAFNPQPSLRCHDGVHLVDTGSS
jgi:hypothetical protein